MPAAGTYVLSVASNGGPAGAYAFDISATDQSVASASGGSDFASLLIGMGEFPGNEQNDYPNFTKDIFAAESNPYYATFVEDTFHASKSLTITAGLRWDIFGGRNERFNRQEYFNPNATNSVNGVQYTGAEIYVNGSNRTPFKTNWHDFGPRLAFAWQPVSHFVVRGGAGFYYGPATHNVASAGQNTDGFASQTPWDATCTNSNGNTVFNGTSCGANTGSAADVFTGDYSISNPFPNAPGTPGGVIPVFTTPPPGLANNLGITLNTVLRSQRTPTTYNFNFGIEYELPHQVIVSAAYVGSRGLFLPLGTVDLNQLDVGTLQRFGTGLCLTNDPSCMVPNPIANLPGAFNGQSTVPQWFALQQYPQFGNGNYGAGSGINVSGYGGGDSEYSSLQTKVQKRLTGHFTTLATFTWGKLMTDDGQPPLAFVGSHRGGAQDWRNLRYEHSIAPQDVKYQFTGQASYDLPVGKGQLVNLNGVADTIVGGWTVNGIAYLGTGVPINSPLSGTSPSYLNQRADLVCNPASGAPHTVNNWFNINCFALPAAPFVPGTAPNYLDHVRTRGARDLDLSIYKTIKLTETKALRFDISGYNMTNTPQYGYPSVNSIVDVQQQGASFGKITKTVNTPRQFQFGARFSF